MRRPILSTTRAPARPAFALSAAGLVLIACALGFSNFERQGLGLLSVAVAAVLFVLAARMED